MKKIFMWCSVFLLLFASLSFANEAKVEYVKNLGIFCKYYMNVYIDGYETAVKGIGIEEGKSKLDKYGFSEIVKKNILLAYELGYEKGNNLKSKEVKYSVLEEARLFINFNIDVCYPLGNAVIKNKPKN